jgi:hypothetical protein
MVVRHNDIHEDRYQGNMGRSHVVGLASFGSGSPLCPAAPSAIPAGAGGWQGGEDLLPKGPLLSSCVYPAYSQQKLLALTRAASREEASNPDLFT